ncbi:CocE/NonD family hydrolase [Kerstersia similis]|uniref:CocE/NonD family hydrolase n=1 Tax=Kerstersia similis TaxID=206505 RepID=UPI0039F13887
MLPTLPPETVAMRTRDGVRLDADIYRPAEAGTYPVLLMRQAYGRRIACTICYAHPSWYAAQGYIVVIQDIRGRGTSEGEFLIGEHDASDGADTIAWAARLPGSNGRVGMYGFSYQGYNQLMAAIEAGPALQAIAPAMTPWDAREGWAWKQGALRLQSTLGWATQLAAETARRRGDADAYAELAASAKTLPLNESVPAWPQYMRRHAALCHYGKWLDTPPEDAYWQRISAAAHAPAIAAKKIPTLFIGGWYDSYNETVLQAWEDLRARGDWPLRVEIGPWLHFPWTRQVGSQDFGPAAESQMDIAQVRWFDRWLKDAPASAATENGLHVFDLAAHSWKTLPQWPGHELRLALSGNGLAALHIGAGRLLAPGTALPQQPGTDYLVNDPWRPAPSVGGPYGTPPGPVDHTPTDRRGDVMTFDTDRLTAPLLLAGPIEARLHLSADLPDFDIACTLSRVLPDGRAIVLADGYARTGGTVPGTAVIVAMHATCATLAAGDALRLSLAASAFPAYALNPGTGENPSWIPASQGAITTLGVHYGPGQQSELRLTLEQPSVSWSA